MFAAPSAAWADALASKTQALRFLSPISITSALRRSSCWPPQVLQAMRLVLTPLFNIMFRTILDPWGRRARDDKETTTTSSPLDGIGCWTHEVIAHCAGFFGEPGVSSENRTWRSSENLEDLDKPAGDHLKAYAGDHLKAYCWRSSENLEVLFICQKGNEIRRDQTLNQPNKPWHMILSSCEPTEYPSPLLGIGQWSVTRGRSTAFPG